MTYMVRDAEVSKPSEHPLLYLWDCCKRFGAEFYRTWRWELFASLLIAVADYGITVYDDPQAWKNLVVILQASAFVLGGFGVWHIIRTPFLVHRETVKGNRVSDHWGFGILGIVALGSMGYGVYCIAHTTVRHYFVAPLPAIVFRAPLAPVIIATPSPSGRRESANSLRHKVWRLADEIDRFWATKRKEAPLPNEEQQMQKMMKWQAVSDREFNDKFKDKILNIVQEVEAKGITAKVDGWFDYSVILVQNQRCLSGQELEGFRELGFHLEANDTKVEITF